MLNSGDGYIPSPVAGARNALIRGVQKLNFVMQI